MNIDKYIEELLFNHECVIIPGLGGFIINDRHATIDQVSHQFNPPFKKILFNQHIKFNDGLLVNYIANKKGISFEAVKKQIEDRVHHYIFKLEEGEKINFENIGTLSFDKNKNITFDQDKTLNFDAESFGLESFVSPPIRRKTEQDTPKGIVQPQMVLPKREDRKTERISDDDLIPNQNKRKHSTLATVRTFTFISLLAVLFAVVSFVLFNTEATGNYWQKLSAALKVQSVKSRYVPRSEQKNELNNSVANQAGFLSGSVFELETPATNTIPENMAEVNIAESKYLSGEIPVEENFNYRGRNLTENSGETANETEFKEPEAPVFKEDIVTPIKPASQYYIIAGSFSEKRNASRLINDLLKKGFPAQIIDTNKNGMYRVAYLGKENLIDAKQELYAIRNEDNPEAWILKK